jgi:hypothetical protein
MVLKKPTILIISEYKKVFAWVFKKLIKSQNNIFNGI